MLLDWLPPREREIVDIVYARGRVTAAQICEAIEPKVTNAAVRSMLRRLEAKAIICRQMQGKRFIYTPALCQTGAREKVLRSVASACFHGSLPEMAREVARMIDKDRRALETAA